METNRLATRFFLALTLFSFATRPGNAQITPTEIKPPSGQTIALVLHAHGEQVYVSQATQKPPGQWEWTMQEPVADLFDESGRRIGKHVNGPTWEAVDGTRLVGVKIGQAGSPLSDALPWLLIEVKARYGPEDGLFSTIEYIQRTDTVGGNAPSAPPHRGNETRRVPYTATYLFWREAPRRPRPQYEFVRAFGRAGSGEGQLKNPSVIALSPKGTIVVADTGNNRIQQFDPEGHFLSAFPVEAVSALTIAPGGEILTGSATKSGISVFDPSGKRLRELSFIGGGSRGLVLGVSGEIIVIPRGGPGALQILRQGTRPEIVGGEAVGGSHFVVSRVGKMAGNYDNAIRLFDLPISKSEGRQAPRTFGEWGSAPGQFSMPAGIAFTPEGNIVVADSGNHRIEIFDPKGRFLTTFGEAGTGNGEFDTPAGIAVDEHGNIVVADNGSGRIQIFAPIVSGQSDSESGQPHLSNAPASFGEQGARAAIAACPNGDLVATCGGWVRVLDKTGSVKISYLRTKDNTVFLLEKDQGKGTTPYSSPQAVTVAPNGDIFIADNAGEGGLHIVAFDRRGQFRAAFGEGVFGRAVNRPLALAVTPAGNLLVTDPGHRCIQMFDGGGHYLGRFKMQETANSGYSPTYSIAVAPSGEVVVATVNGQIRRYDSSGQFLGEFPGWGPVAITRTGTILTVYENRLRFLDGEGKRLSEMETDRAEGTLLSRLVGMTIAPSGDIIVMDAAGRLRRFPKTDQPPTRKE